MDSMSYRFESNSKKFTIDFEVSGIVKGYFPHTGLTAREGICVLYRRVGEQQWFNIDCNSSLTKFTVMMSHFVKKDELYEVLIYGPIISHLSKLQVEVSDDDYASIVNILPEKTMLVAGGSNSHGIGCTTTGFMFSNIIERKFDAEVYHTTFHDKNYLEKIYDYYKNSNPPVVDICILELDYFSQNESVVEEILPEVISLMKKRCKHIIGWYTIPSIKSFKKIIANNIINKFIDNDEIEVIDMSYLYDENYRHMCTFNNYYINDAGNILIYKEIEKSIRRLAKWSI
ncbi:MAG: hypothetical protein BZ135_02310 [Methanosphaera sp. rholeuAM6]|nr:MAG: hypothetical protein BZ135_02310 [Methanosphaera sp. rholeuAM6]